LQQLPLHQQQISYTQMLFPTNQVYEYVEGPYSNSTYYQSNAVDMGICKFCPLLLYTKLYDRGNTNNYLYFYIAILQETFQIV
jgi:hypothetical protein